MKDILYNLLTPGPPTFPLDRGDQALTVHLFDANGIVSSLVATV